MTPHDLQSRVLYRDGSLLVLDKPAGLAVHPGPRTPESLEQHLAALRFGLSEAPRLVHRLDRDTSGCLVLARHARAVRRLGRLFASAQVKKTYWAVVEAGPSVEEGTIDRPLAKLTRPEGWRVVPDIAGERALTRFRVLGRSEGLCWLELQPETGRTHQIRVHCASEGFPVLGDAVYGRSARPDRPLHLHARAISLPRGDGAVVSVSAEPPPHMITALAACGYRPVPR